MTRVGVIGMPGRWSSERLADVLEARTGSRILVHPGRLRVDLDEGAAYADGVDLGELDALVIKKIGGRYRPDHLDRLELLRYVASLGVPVISDPGRILRVLDRLSCTVTLRMHHVPMPPTVITEAPEEAVAAIERFGEAVLKPLFSTKARGMRVLTPGPGLAKEVEAFREAGNEVLYIQKKIDLPGHDLGLAFLGGEYLATYARVGDRESWNTTTRSGGRYEAAEPPAEIIELARRAQEPFGLDFTCVDVGETAEGPVVFEVSAFGGFRGLLEACGIDAAEELADYVLGRVGHGG